MDTYEVDIHTKNIITDCHLYPTEINQSDLHWLYARNNKYTYFEDVNPETTGKWMLFMPKKRVNAVWNKIKMAVTEGYLWISKVSTTDPERTTHAIMVYTKDYTDLNDVIHVLDYLESSGIKPRHLTIKYKTDNQTRAGVYRGGKQKPWIYSSDTVRESRETAATQQCHSISSKDSQIAN